MTLDEANTKFGNAIQELARTQVNDNLLTVLDLIGFVKLRLAEGGGRADGQPFTDYSSPYARVRQKKGLQVLHKDFAVTGQLYASIRPEVKAVAFGKTEIDINVRGADNELKVIGQLKRDGNILEPSPSEIQDAISANTKRRFERASQLI